MSSRDALATVIVPTHDNPQVLLFAHSHCGPGLACLRSTKLGPHVTMTPEPSANSNFRSGIKVSSSSKGRRPFVLPRRLSSCTYTTVHKCSWQIICSVATLILFLNQTKSCRHAKRGAHAQGHMQRTCKCSW